MTNLLDPARPKYNQQPCWLGSAYPIPDLAIRASGEPGIWTVGFWLYEPREGSAGYKWVDLSAGAIVRLLGEWEADPEVALASWFHATPPTGRRNGEMVMAGTAEEMGL